MSSLSLILAMVLFLSSGLGVYAGFFILGGKSQFNAAPPRPSSIVSLSVIVFGSVLTHAIAAVLFALFTWNSDKALFEFGFSPNPYVLALEVALGKATLSGWSLGYLLAWTAIIPCGSTLVQHQAERHGAHGALALFEGSDIDPQPDGRRQSGFMCWAGLVHRHAWTRPRSGEMLPQRIKGDTSCRFTHTQPRAPRRR